MVSWQLAFTKQAQKEAKKLAQSGLKPQAERLLETIKENPFRNPPPYEKLVSDLSGAYSSRINIQHRRVYEVLDNIKSIKIIRMWTYYEWPRRENLQESIGLGIRTT